MRTKPQSRQRKMSWAGMLITLAVITLFYCSQEALAQQWSTSGNDIYNSNSGNVGVGTTSPGVKLDILSSVNLIARFGSTAGTHSQVLIDAPVAYNANLTLQRGGVSKWYMGNRASNDRLSFIESTGVFETLTLLQNGYVGIGITTPLYSLDVNGGINGFRAKAATTSVNDAIATFENTNGIQAIVRGNGNVGIGTTTPAVPLDLKGTNVPFGGQLRLQAPDFAQITFYNSNSPTLGSANRLGHIYYDMASTSLFVDANVGNKRLLLQAAGGGGNVGIGLTNPTYKLHVNGSFNATSINLNGSPLISSQWFTSGTDINYSTGNVGIGTNSPLALLDVRNSDGLFYAGFGYGTNKETFIRAGSSTTGVLHVGDLNTTKTLLQESGGNVGIGTATPNSQYKLDVAGNINSSGTITGNNIVAKYQDVAEWVESSQELSAGTLVVLDHTKSNQVIASSQAYDTRVAGVISERPGIALGEAADNKVLVGTTGRVRLAVDASRGPIQIGDLLVTSNIPGVAMKSEAINIGGVQIHRPGTLVGKALEPLAKGQGKILVLLSLQ